ncbi:MAG: hypothetical protein JST06_00285 [Bacteroidetes bacterium]|nr:hypothetical protein [Bacteroidota bacterium]MBS1629955.1 hypothetical protein [Bacteroidota bacterium]
MLDQKSNGSPVVLAIPAQAFFHLGIREGLQTHQLSFSVKAEENIRYYVIEGSQDLVSFEQLMRVFAKGNSALPSSYTIPIHDTQYHFYRVRQIDSSVASIPALEEPSEGKRQAPNLYR